MREIGQCPACDGWVEIFASDQAARVRCPHCGQPFGLDQLIPVDVRPAEPMPSDRPGHRALRDPSPATVDDDDLMMAPLEELDAPARTDRAGQAAMDASPSMGPTAFDHAETEPPGDRRPETATQLHRPPAVDPGGRTLPVTELPSATVEFAKRQLSEPFDAEPATPGNDSNDSHRERLLEDADEQPGSLERLAADEDSGVAAAEPRLPTIAAAETGDRRRGHPRRKQKNLGLELVKVVAGGIAGLVMAQLILWWLPGSMRRDPFRLAPHLPAWLHFAMPAELQAERPLRRSELPPPREFIRPEPAIPDDQPQPAANPFADEPSDWQDPAESGVPEGGRQTLAPAETDDTAPPGGLLADRPTHAGLTLADADQIALATGLDDDHTADAHTAGLHGTGPLTAESDAAESYAAESDFEAKTVTANRPVLPDDTPRLPGELSAKELARETDSSLTSASADQPDADAVYLPTDADRDAAESDRVGAMVDDDGDFARADHAPMLRPQYDGVELQRALALAMSAMEHVSRQAGQPRDVRAQAARQFYQRLAEVAQVVSFVQTTDTDFGRRMNASEALLGRIARDSGLLMLVNRTAPGWLDFPARTSDGIAVVGEVAAIETNGEVHEVTVRSLPPAEGTFRIVSVGDPAFDARAPYRYGDRVLVLGSIVSQPRQHWPTFDAPGPVILSGLHLVLGD